MAAAATALAAVAAVALVLLAARPVHGASGNVVVSLQVPSHTALTDQCAAPAAYRFGSTLPGGSYTSATGADVCRFSFTSSNDSSMLRIRQADGVGATMARTQAATKMRWGARMGGVVAASASVAYAVEYQRSGFYATTDGGATWTTGSAAPGYGNNTSITTLGTSTILITRQFGRISRSTDSGATFTTLTTPNSATNTGLYDVAVPSATAAYAVGDGGTILKSTDAGATWASLASPVTSVRLKSVAAPDDANVFIATTDSRLLRSTNGGASWTVSTLAMPASGGVDISAPDASTVWITGNSSTVLRSVDGGATFTAVNTPSGMSTGYTIDAIDGNRAWVAGVGTSYLTTNGGASWTALSGTQSIVNQVSSFDGTRAYFGMFGQTVAVTPDEGATWSYPINNGGDMYGAWTNGRDHHVVVGTYGRIERSTDSGDTWNAIPSGTLARLDDVELEGRFGWAVGRVDGATAAIVATSDGGAAWSRQASGVASPVELEGVAALEHGRAVAVGDAGTIVRTTDGGATWVARSSGTASNLNGVSGSGSLVVAAGNSGTVLVSSDGGDTWTARAVGMTTNTLEDASVVNEQVAWVAGANGTVLRTTDGGATWASIGSGNGSHDYIQVSAPSRDVAWALRGDWGSTTNAHRTIDGGSSWEIGGSTLLAPRAAAAVDGETLVMTGMSADTVRSYPTVELPDYASATSNWASSGGMFGACLQAIGGGATVADWPVDAAGTAGRCEPDDADPWRAVPIAPATLARAAAGATGSVDVVWGVRVPAAAAPGRYTAGVQVELLAPAV